MAQVILEYGIDVRLVLYVLILITKLWLWQENMFVHRTYMLQHEGAKGHSAGNLLSSGLEY